jgi:CheY-like chemotaxis protein
MGYSSRSRPRRTILRMAKPDPPWQVLVADDSPEIREVVRCNLEYDGRFEVVEAADGDEAIRMAAGTQPDAVVLDVAMGAMSGFDALPLIREAVDGHVVVLVLSALDRRATAAQAHKAGAAFVPKLELCALPRRLAQLCIDARGAGPTGGGGPPSRPS